MNKPDPRPTYASGAEAMADLQRTADDKQAVDDVMPDLLSDDEFIDTGDEPLRFHFDEDDDGDTLADEV